MDMNMTMNLNKQFLKDTLGWGLVLWLIGFALGMLLFPFVPTAQIGWFITPVGIAVALWVLFTRVQGTTFGHFLGIAFVWTVLAVLLDYVFIVTAFKPSDGYYKVDVYLYYTLTFILPLAVGLWRDIRKK